MKNIFFYQTEIGEIGIAENGNAITNLYFKRIELIDNFNLAETKLIKEAYSQLKNYLLGDIKKFTLPLNPEGTDFMKKVWNSLTLIPYGQTCTYKEVAKSTGNEKASRAVGLANNKNPIPIFIPCHRVIGANGKLVGYSGGIDIKKYLLNLERTNIKDIF
ncbi:methylated-DNA--[protein]-cysteine S-methyltransferase [Clostridium weizhouense]|uniref:Methylated-DNA--protein-cysteine methyltransferase n=1 Tax=Clostridium weizhouense TaxID=2859781 RepID=A0ABS7ALI6_9CLOT|nr:methylated-DNA--[protein]-cysteine S-methyltransferase [Clostridium weizhouense]MBW6409429.1 methylated-DNA--[protein]-cysteine S-methyltransferase [Clostridium weizhouense]